VANKKLDMDSNGLIHFDVEKQQWRQWKQQ
jgi:hypothetical protein